MEAVLVEHSFRFLNQNIYLKNKTQTQDENSAAALSVLTEAMLELDTVAIVRRVYRKGLRERV